MSEVRRNSSLGRLTLETGTEGSRGWVWANVAEPRCQMYRVLAICEDDFEKKTGAL